MPALCSSAITSGTQRTEHSSPILCRSYALIAPLQLFAWSLSQAYLWNDLAYNKIIFCCSYSKSRSFFQCHSERGYLNRGINLTKRAIKLNARKGRWGAPKRITYCCNKKKRNISLWREVEGLTNDKRLKELQEDTWKAYWKRWPLTFLFVNRTKPSITVWRLG